MIADVLPVRLLEPPTIGLVITNGSLLTRIRRLLVGRDYGSVVECSGLPRLARMSRQVDLALLEVSGDRAEVVNSVRAARGLLPLSTALVAICAGGRPGDTRGLVRAGADGLVNEADLDETFLATVYAVLSGALCVPRTSRADLATENLSMREKQVLGLIVMGSSNAEIARKLFLAESTVKSHLSSAYSKLGVRSRKDAASLILDPAEGLGPGILATAVS